MMSTATEAGAIQAVSVHFDDLDAMGFLHNGRPMHIHFWLSRLGETSASYDFEFRSPDGQTLYANGCRVVIRLDPQTLRPAPWSPSARLVARGLLRV